MKTVYNIYILLFALVIISCEDKNSYLLKVNINGLQNSEIYIVSGEDLKLDTIQTKLGKFTYRGVSQTTEPLLIYIENKNVWISLWVQNGEKYSLSGDADCPEMITVRGGEVNKILSEFKTENSSLLKEKCELKDKIYSRLKHSGESNTAISDAQLYSQLRTVNQLLKSQAQDFVETHPSSIATLVLIQDYILDIESASDVQPFLDLVAEEVKANPLYDKLYTHCLKDLQTKVGQPALDFRITDTKNDTISLETFKDKYLILTFASSFCEFCEQEYAELLAIQDTFPKKELAILTIALDENKEDWKRLSEEQEINWFQVIDTAGWASEMVSLFNVLTIPCNYLIDKNGIIIGSKLHPDDIQTILYEKLKDKR